ncbi:hypothetical protein JX266_006679 [Neoarthrinium moseri]|uniref:uncharacterized protein n=1 Tax=Neoarthrinium moseri TaxID=1658444 RepID=UPI001FDE8BD9|nr:uncharacterized protein JN550_013468 [Neoarthrinium moseri]KAI1847139.1 hypothetical protein JX266_006679 [Neoarthrinium moseri]KAI1857024.1 hypothetical protein JN550_013468 [Neoarthrinium moseri]
MRIACLQFAPQVGDVDNNLNRADAVLSRANPDDLDLLVLPEMAFSGASVEPMGYIRARLVCNSQVPSRHGASKQADSGFDQSLGRFADRTTGYNFKSLSDISPFLEPTCAGITSLWARTTALKYNCTVAAGYPEKVDVSPHWPTSPEYYNSVIVVNQEGETIANYRKSHLYYTDETWALEGPSGFHKGFVPGIGRIAMGICMDLNPYRFEAPWSAFEFAFHILDVSANVVILSMAWLTREDARHFSRMPKEPDMETLTYWVKRLEPLIRADNDDEIIVVFANRTGLEDEAVYAGTSAVLGIQNGEVSVYGLLGRGEKELLVVDTSLPPFAKLVYRPEGETNVAGDVSVTGTTSASVADKSVKDKSPTSSNASTSSTTSRSTTSKPSIHVDDGGEASRESTRRIFGGHVFISQDTLTPMTGTFPNTPFEESPASPRYFWVPPEHLRTPDFARPSSRTSSTRSRHTDSSVVPSNTNEAQPAEDTSQVFTPRNTDRASEISELIETLRQTTAAQSSGDQCPARPSSPKSRNASRTGRGERSDSVLARRPTSAMGHRTQAPTVGHDTILFRPESPKSRNASRNQSRTRSFGTATKPEEHPHTHSPSRNQNRRPTPLDPGVRSAIQTDNRHQIDESAVLDGDQDRHCISPDMNKIGADLLVFEEGGRRPRRDSLECHADEDDFIVFHASKRRERPATERVGPERDSEGSHSQKGAKASYADSPGLRSGKISSTIRSSSKPQASPDLPNARATSRGRQRNPKWVHTKNSLKLSDYKSPAPMSPPDLHQRTRSPGPDSSSQRYKSPENMKGPSLAPVEPSNCMRGESTHQQQRVQNSGGRSAAFVTNSLRASSLESIGQSPDKYASSIRTIETTSAPTTPESIPPTPKAMVLEPDWDKAVSVPISAIEPAPLRSLNSGLDRPKSMVW